MRRRDFITLLGGTAATWTLVARAQQPTNERRLAIVHPSTPVAEMSESGDYRYRALFEELRGLGHVEGRNLIVEHYSAEGR